MSVLVFCSTKKWCQQTANLLAKEILLDRNRAAATASVVAAAKKCYSNSSSPGLSKEGASPLGFVRAKSIALEDAGAAAAKSTELHSKKGEGMPSAAQLVTGATVTVTPAGKEGSKAERPRPVCPTTADTVRERLRQTPVGLDAELSYLVRHAFVLQRGLGTCLPLPRWTYQFAEFPCDAQLYYVCVHWYACTPCPGFTSHAVLSISSYKLSKHPIPDSTTWPGCDSMS